VSLCADNRAFLYIVVQSVGAIVGAGILKGLTFVEANSTVVEANSTVDVVCTPQPSRGVTLGQTFGVEMITAFVLVLTVFATCDSLRSGIGGSGPLAIGLSISMCHLWAVSDRLSYYRFGNAYRSPVLLNDFSECFQGISCGFGLLVTVFIKAERR